MSAVWNMIVMLLALSFLVDDVVAKQFSLKEWRSTRRKAVTHPCTDLAIQNCYDCTDDSTGASACNKCDLGYVPVDVTVTDGCQNSSTGALSDMTCSAGEITAKTGLYQGFAATGTCSTPASESPKVSCPGIGECAVCTETTSTGCTQCRKNYVVNTPANDSASADLVCTACNDSSVLPYSPGGSTVLASTCVDCVTGENGCDTCSTDAKGCTTCSTGYGNSVANATTSAINRCVDCTLADLNCISCTATANVPVCSKCANGYHGTTTCTQCGTGAATCTSSTASTCLAGYYKKLTTTANVYECEECPVNTFSDDGNESAACTDCAADTYVAEGEGTSIAKCGECLGNCAECSKTAKQCITCESGYGGILVSGSTEFSACVACGGDAYACTAVTTTAGSTTTITTTITSCNAGFSFTAAADSVTATAKCEACDKNTWSADNNKGACTTCAAGTYADAGGKSAEACIDCSLTIPNCEICASSITCSACPSTGYYATEDSGLVTKCTACVDNCDECSDASSTIATCTKCKENYGKYKPDSGTEACKECATDTDDGGAYIVSDNTCTLCSAVTALGDGCFTCTSTTVCTTVKLGYYLEIFVADTTANPPTSGTAKAIECAANSYGGGDKSTSCTACTSGISEAGSISSADCVACINTEKDCTTCADETSCATCATDKPPQNTGTCGCSDTTICSNCGDDGYCTKAVAGYYLSADEDDKFILNACPAGYYCEEKDDNTASWPVACDYGLSSPALSKTKDACTCDVLDGFCIECNPTGTECTTAGVTTTTTTTAGSISLGSSVSLLILSFLVSAVAK